MRVAVIQMSPGADKAENIAQARALIEALAAEQKVDLIALPEIWTCLGGDRAQKFAAAEALPEPGGQGGEAYEFLRGMAMAHNLHIHGGSIGELAGDKLFNTSLVFSPAGNELARYRKIHLFDITTPDGQGYRESAIYGAGDKVVTCDIAGTRIGLAICYDLRFPELFLALRRQHVDLIVLPAAFTLQTGKDHWEVLLRARAIETQTWIAAPACTGAHKEANGETRYTYGHSLIVDPWGHVVAKASDGLGWAAASIDKSLTARVRTNMPLLDHRRLA
ncbi:MAG: carbon-nitrogen hydrolase family protein [Acidocella sp.]|nr:carbon-nitrogen hydrolase family protein [Acidocella sp.]